MPPEYVEAVFNKKNATTKNTFTVDGFVAGAWRIEQAEAASLEPFAPLPARARREVEAEGERLRCVLRELGREERQLGLALAAQHREVDLDAARCRGSRRARPPAA